jgi:hypothetical protein
VDSFQIRSSFVDLEDWPSKSGIALLCLIEKIEEIRAALSQPDWPSICNLVLMGVEVSGMILLITEMILLITEI